MINKNKVIIFSLVFLFCNSSVFSQKLKNIGFSIGHQYFSLGQYNTYYGLTYTQNLYKNHGIKSGIFFRNLDKEIFTYVPDQLYQTNVVEYYLAVPLQYAFNSKILNVAAGAQFDYFTAWRQREKNSINEVTNYKIKPMLSSSILFCVSKDFAIKKFIIEPEINYMFTPMFKQFYIGTGFILRYDK